MSHWDVIVLGLGGVGSAAAYHLASQGLRTLGIDQFSPPHDRGSSHGRSRVIRQAYFEDPAYVPLLRRAYELWESLEQQSGSELFCKTGLVEIGPADGVVIRGVKESAMQHDLPIEALSAREVAARWPVFQGESNWAAVIELNAGYLKVEDCVAAHLEQNASDVCELRFQQHVTKLHATESKVSVTTGSVVETADHLIIAAGPWLGKAVPELANHLNVIRKHQYWFEAQPDQWSQSSGTPCFFFDTPEGYFYGFPDHGAGVKIARHSGGQLIPGPTEHHEVDQEDDRLTRSFADRYLRGVTNKIISSAGCYYTSTPDEHFIIDHHPEHKNITVVGGLSGHGFKFTSVLGELAATLASGNVPKFDLSLFRLKRLLEDTGRSD